MRWPASSRPGSPATPSSYVRTGESGWWRQRENRVLALCGDNLVRSPLAAALIADALELQRVEAEVRACGIDVTEPAAPPPAVLAALRRRGMELDHVAQPLEARLLVGADLVLTMTTAQRDTVESLEPDAGVRTFTVRDAVRRARIGGPRRPAEPLRTWLERLGGVDDPGSPEIVDLPEPAGADEIERCAAELEALVRVLVPLAWPLASMAHDAGGRRPDRPEGPLLPPLRAVAPPEGSVPPPTPGTDVDLRPGAGFVLDDAILTRIVRELLVTGELLRDEPDGPMAAGIPRDGSDWPAPRTLRWSATTLGGATVWLHGRSPTDVARWAHAITNRLLVSGRAAQAVTGGSLPDGLNAPLAALTLADAGLVAVVAGAREDASWARAAHAWSDLTFVEVRLDDESDPRRAVLDALGLWG